MGRLDCIHRGDQVRVLACGCPSGVAVLACNHPDRPDECVLMKDGGKRGAAIEAAGLQDCRTCGCKVEPPPRPPMPLIGSQCLVMSGQAEPTDIPLPNRLWKESRAFRRFQEKQKRATQ